MALTNTADGTLVAEVAHLADRASKRRHDIYRQVVLMHDDGDITTYDDPKLPAPTTLAVTTLQAVADYVTQTIGMTDALDNDDTPLIVHICDPGNVQIIRHIVGPERQKFVYVSAQPYAHGLALGKYLDTEEFLIQLQSQFVLTDSREDIQRLIGNLKTGIIGEVKDDGILQTVKTTSGLTREKDNTISNQWVLSPYRTFPEIAPVESTFILRVRQRKAGDAYIAEAALFEADGGKWRTDTIREIGLWLRERIGKDAVILA